MRITVQYAAQVKAAAGRGSQTLELAEGADVDDVVQRAAAGNEALQRLLIGADGRVQPTLLMFIGEECISRGKPVTLKDGDTLTIMTPISGG